MERNQVLNHLSVAFGLTLISACSISPSKTVARLSARAITPLELKNDSIQVGTMVRFLPKSLDKRSIAKITPVIKYGPNLGKTTTLDPIYIKGASASLANASKVIPTKDGGAIQYSRAIPYDSSMQNSYLYVQVTVTRGGFEADTLIALSPGANTTVELMHPEPQLIFTEQFEPVEQTVGRQTELYYKIGAERFDPHYTDKERSINNQEQVQMLTRYLDNSSHLLQSITVSSYASPDGNLKANEKLAAQRAGSTIQYIRTYMKRKGFAEVEDSKFFMKTATSEDWVNFERLLLASSIRDKTAILKMIQEAPVKDDKLEQELAKKFPEAYQEIRKSIYTKLRRAEVQLVLIREIEKEEQLIVLLQNTDKLSPNDFLYYGANAKGAENKKRIYEAFQEKYPGEWKGYNNIGCLLVQEQQYAEARQYFEKALLNSPGNAEVINNIGVSYLMEKNYVLAEEHFRKANSSKVNTSSNQGLLFLKKGDYEEAVSSYRKTGKCSYNFALALLLNNNNSEAKTQLNCLDQNEDSSHVAYLKAIVGARMEETGLWQENLKQAIASNPELRQRAWIDVEFLHLREMEEFRQILNE